MASARAGNARWRKGQGRCVNLDTPRLSNGIERRRPGGQVRIAPASTAGCGSGNSAPIKQSEREKQHCDDERHRNRDGQRSLGDHLSDHVKQGQSDDEAGSPPLPVDQCPKRQGKQDGDSGADEELGCLG